MEMKCLLMWDNLQNTLLTYVNSQKSQTKLFI